MSTSGSTSGNPLAALLNERRIRALGDALFTLTDAKAWDAARALFVDGEIDVDMSSLAGGGPLRMTAADLFSGFAAGLHAGKESHHMATNFQVTVEGDAATLTAQGYAWNRLTGPGAGSDLWETWGTYRLPCRRTAAGWRLAGFEYVSKFTRGDDAIRTHTA